MTSAFSQERLARAAAMFKALSDPARLETLILLAERERNVSELALAEGDKIGTVSARLKVLTVASLVTRRREGQSIIYAIADAHVLAMINNAIEHACEDHLHGANLINPDIERI